MKYDWLIDSYAYYKIFVTTEILVLWEKSHDFYFDGKNLFLVFSISRNYLKSLI